MKIRVAPEDYQTTERGIYTTCPDCGADQLVQPGTDQECDGCGSPYAVVVEWPDAQDRSTDSTE